MSSARTAITAVCIITALFAGASLVFGQTDIFSGYGYGYGTSCTADRPSGLTASQDIKTGQITLTWSAVAFSDCADIEPDRYILQIHKNNGSLIKTYSKLHKTNKIVKAGVLSSNLAYKFRVRAQASDDTKTKWSQYYLFRTMPDAPTGLVASNVIRHRADLSWNTVVRSGSLQYYQVEVVRKGSVRQRKRIHTGLKKPTMSTSITHLHSDRSYKVRVRAVYSSSVRGPYARITIHTL